MKRIGYLFEPFTDFSNLYLAAKKALKGSHNSQEALAFYFHMEKELLQLQQELIGGTYQPGAYRYFTIKDPKERRISVAPFRDRVVHHALVNILEPIYEKRFIYYSYATRKGKGTHRAIYRAQQFLRKNRWFLKSDVEKYFDSVDHAILKNILQRKIRDKRFLRVLFAVINNGGQNGKGLPVGNLTSQFLANVYLDILDKYIKQELRVKYYIRYMDDFVLFSHDKAQLKEIRQHIRLFLDRELHLQMKENATYINQRLNGLTFLGMRSFPNLIRIRNENLKRSIKKLRLREKQFLNNKIDESQWMNSVQSILEHMNIANSWFLKKEIFGTGGAPLSF